MLPLRLRMKNFLAYRSEVELDFDGIRLACLTGHNGAGKSSILDAITFALWGKGRGSHGDLIHLGESEAIVELEFLHQGARYRIVRRAQRGKANKQTCEFYALEDGQQWKTLGGAVRETNAQIADKLRLPYDIFVNSAYLQQGRADSFTTMGAANRKKTLADILGIAAWESYEQRAKDARDAHEGELLVVESRLLEWAQDVQQQPALVAALTTATDRQRQAEADLTALEAAFETLQDADRRVQQSQLRRQELERTIAQRAEELHSQQRRLAECEDRIAGHQRVLAEEAAIAEGYQRFLAAQQQNDALNEQLQRIRPLEQRRSALERAIADARAQLEKAASRCEARLEELQRQARSVADAPATHELASRIAELDALASVRSALVQEVTSLSQQRGQIAQQQKQWEAEAKKIKKRIDDFSRLTDAICPTCGQPMSEEHRTHTLAEWHSDVALLRENYRQANADLNQLTEAMASNQARQDEITQALVELPRLQMKLGEVKEMARKAAEAAAFIDSAAAERDACLKRLQAEDYALGERASLREVQAHLDQLTYNSDQHEQLRQVMADLRAFEQRSRTLDAARQMLPHDHQRREDILEQLRRLVEERQQAQQALAEVDAQLPALNAAASQMHEVKAQRDAAHQQAQAARDEVVTLQQELRALEAKRAKIRENEQRRDALRVDISRYKELVTAFSKKGVPAMIIETAIPELEDLTNDLLRRMTNGRMNIRLTTQQPTQAGGVSETLDIEIADELGTRSYEMYSGGEAFRVNFALRVALSKLVARRSGSPLRALFIDEGFGTQDEEGRLRLVEAITAVQEDFEMILVITHMDDLRDAFPVHIVVEKTAQGSTLRLR